MKIAIVRGPSLNLWEMQDYLPLTQKHELLAIGSLKGHYAWGSGITTKKLLCLGEPFSFIPGGIKFLYRRFGDPQIILGLERAVYGFDVVHTAECSNYYSFQALKARRKGWFGKLVVTCWENIAGAHEDYPAQRKIKKEVIEGADYFLAVTNGAKEALLADGVVAEKITVIPMGVDIDKFRNQESPLRQGLVGQAEIRNQGKRSLEILFVGRMVEEKGVLELLEAFKMVCKQLGDDVDFRLRMVGNGPLYNRLMQRAQEWGILEKLVIEEKNYSEMPEVYRSADTFVLPSKPKKDWQEQFGMVLVEAMASGLPIITTRTGAIPEVVGEAGILVEPGDVAGLSGAIVKVLKDKKIRTDLSIRGRKRAEVGYDCQKVALKIEKLYQKVLGD